MATVITTGDKWINLEFTWMDGLIPRTTVVQLNAHDVGITFVDRSIDVATILVQAITAKPGYVCTKASSTTEVTTNLLS